MLRLPRIATLFIACFLGSDLHAQQEPYLFILGIVQDAGYPQIGCYEQHCMPGWENPALARDATSLALVDPRENAKYLFEATPHLPRQLFRLDQEAPGERYDLAGIFLTHAHIGHYAGLMFLGHEAMGASAVPVYAMPRMAGFLRDNGPWSQLVDFNNISLRELRDELPVSLGRLRVMPFLVPHRDEYSETVGYRIQGPNRSALFIPDINKWADWDRDLAQLIRSVDYALLDATFYADGELGNRDMSRIPHPFVAETMALLSEFDNEQRGKVWFIHLNHTNPLLDDSSDESRYVRQQGYNIAREGLRLPL